MTRGLLRRAVASALTAGVLAAGGAALAAPAQAAVPDGYYRPGYTDQVFRVTGGDARVLSYGEWVAAGSPAPQAAPTDYVHYPFSPDLYAITFWGDAPGAEQWLVHHLSGQEWHRAGAPRPRDVSAIGYTAVYRWSTSDEVFLREPSGRLHKLTEAQWASIGYPAVEQKDEGFVKLSWAAPIARIGEGANGYWGGPISAGTWREEGYPTPRVSTRITGDVFYKLAGSPTVYYSGPTLVRALTPSEWAAAGSPLDEVRPG